MLSAYHSCTLDYENARSAYHTHRLTQGELSKQVDTINFKIKSK